MIIDMDDFEIDLEELTEAFGRMFQKLDVDETDDEKIYHHVTIFMASMLAAWLQDEYGENPKTLDKQVKESCGAIAEDLEQKIRAFLK